MSLAAFPFIGLVDARNRTGVRKLHAGLGTDDDLAD